MTTEFEQEAARRALERSERLQRQVKESGYEKEGRRRREAIRLVSRWSEGIQVKDKRTSRRFIFMGNVVEEGVTRYKLKVTCPFGYPSICFSVLPDKEIVRV